MQNPYDFAHSLARSIRRSDVYKELQEAQQEVENNPKFKEMLINFRKLQMEVQSLIMQGKEPTPEKKEHMEKLTMAVQGVPAIMKYLQAEERFGIFMNDIQKIILEPANDLFKKWETKAEK
ncbi:YlbF family regulator [Thermoflavimicrobium dichotomicum]|uniref:UPF0342 protein SAMN05421852_102151 n=1 Tax=Thermoflavimicrobium dichotomicum TaxID=46223 RepID=A0A1I3LDY2_9BACL|nr:YlbF family regulator [Thermoflavimicrobium dichotomicum]SFI82989.1 Cell fate regulator YlbF, YheA/YmcA/DUF963 family (controls sporulation, competence, biofilm development) [Thermoflavimicrobium dichotomicum]